MLDEIQRAPDLLYGIKQAIFERRDGAVVAVECKLSTTVGQADFRHLEHLRDRFRGGVVVHLGSATLPFGDRLWATPASALWS